MQTKQKKIKQTFTLKTRVKLLLPRLLLLHLLLLLLLLRLLLLLLLLRGRRDS